MELRHLRYFVKIAETSSFTRAAAALRVSQPTLSHQIRQLEDETRTPLFDRVGRSIQITEPGRVFLRHAQRALQELEIGLAAVNELKGLMNGELRVGVFRSFANSLLPAVLAEFYQAYPRVRTLIQQTSLANMELGLVNGTLDMAITTYLPPTSELVVSERLFTEPLVLAVGRQHALYGCAEVALNEIAHLPLVLRPSGTPSRQLIEKCFAASGFVPKIEMEMNSGEAALATVRCSGLATICGGRSLQNVPGIAAVRIDEPALRRSGAILWHRDRYRSTAAVAFAELAQRAYALDASGEAA